MTKEKRDHMNASVTLLTHQKKMLTTVAKILINSFTPSMKKLKEEELRADIPNIKLNKRIINAYHAWFNQSEKYKDKIAPHLFPLWSYPTLFKLGRSMNLPLHKVLNQGCKMIINHDLPDSELLQSNVHIFDVKNMEQKYRINQKIITGTKNHPEAVVSEIYAVIIKNPKKYLKAKKSTQPINVTDYSLVETIEISKEDARSYAYISGDVNPIHLSKRIAKLMGLQNSIMHGFGLFALLFESLETKFDKLKEIDVKFLKPVYLDSKVHIYTKQLGENRFQVRLLSEDLTAVHLTGEFKF